MFGSLRLPKVALIGIAVILAGTAASVWWVFRDKNVVLFEALDANQLNAVSADLDSAGIPYRIDRGHGAISVAPTESQRARLAIMSSGNAFRESTGFELFNNSDFGMTEFAQRINYQRAMEGELARTISALGEVKYARVHLVLPDHGLFRAQKQQPRAAVTVFPERGVTLDRAQVRGIQRLTASAVPELEEKNVSVMDETGVILSASDTDEDQPMSGGRLAQKQAVERYLSDKVRAVLTQAIGAQRFAVSVDATLDFNQRTTTTERVLDAPASSGIKRLKETSHTGKGEQSGDERLKEVEYDLGREVEQVVHDVGGIRGVQVGVIIDRDVGPIDIGQLREVIATAVSADASRGDKVTVIQHGVAVQRALERLQPPPSAIPQTKIPAPVASYRQSPLSFWWVAALVVLGALSVFGVKRSAARARLLRQQEMRQRLSVWIEGESAQAQQP
jgi:flagellar M-ring protein FliF